MNWNEIKDLRENWISSKTEFWENITIFRAKKHFSQLWRYIPFSNACGIQINLGTNYLLKKTVLGKMGCWQKKSEFGKKVGCFKAPLGSLGLSYSNFQRV